MPRGICVWPLKEHMYKTLNVVYGEGKRALTNFFVFVFSMKSCCEREVVCWFCPRRPKNSFPFFSRYVTQRKIIQIRKSSSFRLVLAGGERRIVDEWEEQQTKRHLTQYQFTTSCNLLNFSSRGFCSWKAEFEFLVWGFYFVRIIGKLCECGIVLILTNFCDLFKVCVFLKLNFKIAKYYDSLSWFGWKIYKKIWISIFIFQTI